MFPRLESALLSNLSVWPHSLFPAALLVLLLPRNPGTHQRRRRARCAEIIVYIDARDAPMHKQLGLLGNSGKSGWLVGSNG